MTSRRTRQPPRRAKAAPRKAVGRAQPARRTPARGGARTPRGGKATGTSRNVLAKATAKSTAKATTKATAQPMANAKAAERPGSRWAAGRGGSPDYHLFDVHLPDERGALARLARTLAEARVNIDGFVANRGGVQVLTAEAAKADTALRQAAYHFRSVAVREAELEERPGALANLAERLAWDWTSIESGFGLALGKRARVFLQVHEDQSSP